MTHIFVGNTLEEAKQRATDLNIDIHVSELEPAKWLSPNTTLKIVREIKKKDTESREYYELLAVWFSDIWSEDSYEKS